MISARFASIVAIVAFALLLFVALNKPVEVKTREQAVKFLLDDLNSDPQLAAGEKLFKIFSTEYSNETGEWNAVVKITLSPHSQCPTVLIRNYQLLPIRHGLDKVVTQNCQIGSPIAFVEEAIIASRKAFTTEYTSRAYACGYKLPFNAIEAKEYCQGADEVAIYDLATSVDNAEWVAEWRTEEGKKYVALDGVGKVITVK